MSKAKGLLTRILELSAEYPALEYQQIAALLRVNKTVVKSIMGTDAFIDKRAKLIMDKHGEKILGIKAKVYDTTFAILEAIQARIEDNPDSVNEGTLLKLAEFFMPYSVQSKERENPDPTGPGNGSNVNVTISLDRLEYAKGLIENRGRTIDLPATTRPQINAKDRSKI